MKLRKLFLITLVSLLVITVIPPDISAKDDKKSQTPGISWEDEDGPSPPISHGTINTFTDIHWGKSELFPSIATVFHPQELDVYEYDKDWVMVKYETTLYVGIQVYAYSFYGYVKRSEITCDPELEGDSSPKAKTGSANKKAKKPKTKNTEPSSEASETGPTTQTAETTGPDKDVPVDKLEEFDWIIRTPGLQQKTVKYQQADIVYKFSLMAEKFGGVAASSDPRFNNGKHNPYAAVSLFSMDAPMEEMLKNLGAASQFMNSTGGATQEGQATGAKMYIDTGADDFSLVNFALNFNMKANFDPSIEAETGNGQIKGSVGGFSSSSVVPLNMQLKKSGGGYEIIIKGVKVGGGDLQFPALLEKFPSDQDRRDAQDADKRRKAAEDKINKQLEDMKKSQPKDGNGNDDPLAPLVPSDGDDALAPLVPSDSGDDTLAPLVPPDGNDDALAPLVPQDGDTADRFPTPKN